jgi:periplasmic protein TonB
MTATTVPPPGLVPIGAPELRANTRRFFSRAFVISGAAHLAVLSLVLWIQSRGVEPELRLTRGFVEVVPTPPVIPELPKITEPPSTPRPIDLPPDIPNPIPNPVPVPKVISPAGGGERKERPLDGVVPGTAPLEIPGDPVEPAEGQFVAYDKPPIPYYRPEPSYPAWPREAGIEGRVVLHVLVGRDGRVTRITVIRAVGGLTDAAREAIGRWLFHPALSGKNPVAVWVEIPIEFKL